MLLPVWHDCPLPRGCRVGLLVPDAGPLAASTLLTLLNHACVVPLPADHPDPVGCWRDACVQCVVSFDEVRVRYLAERLNNAAAYVAREDVVFDEVRAPDAPPGGTTSGLDDTVLLLHTSGTTAKPKRVPFTLLRLLRSGEALARSMGLTPHDVGLGVMPLHHVGGIACNLFAPLVSGSRMVHGGAFDAAKWWRLAEEGAVTWCYMVPTMWTLALRHHRSGSPAPPLRLVRSGAAHMPPPLAERLRETFPTAHVLPTYSMTECMPIASPPAGYNLEKSGSVGRAVEVRVVALDESGRELPPGKTGELALDAGAHLFDGYEGYDAAARPFPTGDVGHVDEDGWIFVTGRRKECINKGGELLFPTALEAEWAQPDSVDLMAFAAPHEELGETVGAAVVGEGAARTLAALPRGPQVIVVVDELPRTATRKVQRVGFAARVGLPASHGAGTRLFRYDGTTLSPLQAVRVEHTVADLLLRLADAVSAKCGASFESGDRVQRTASGTAKYTLHLRYLAHRLGFGSDHLAAKLMPAFWETEWPRAWDELYERLLVCLMSETGTLGHESGSVWSTLFPSIPAGSFGVGYLHQRTRYFDEVVESHADACEQLVVLGAGFDTRCYRLARYARSFEVDAPTTQACKRHYLEQAGIDASHTVFVDVDFEQEDWMTKLRAASTFDPYAPTLFLWEGVSYYLPAAAVDATLRSIADTCPRCRVVYDIYYAWFSEHPRVAALMRHGFGEPLRSGVTPGCENASARAAGLETLDVVRPAVAARTYGPYNASGGMVSPAFPAYAFVAAGAKDAGLPSFVRTADSEEEEGVDVPDECTSGETADVLARVTDLFDGRLPSLDESLEELGVDSLTELELREIVQRFDCPLGTLRTLL